MLANPAASEPCWSLWPDQRPQSAAGLDQNTLRIQLADQLLEFRVLVALVGRVAALSDGQAQAPPSTASPGQ